MTGMRLIFNADDFGWYDGQNRAVEQAHRQGVLNRASLLCNGDAFDEAIAIARHSPGLEVGVHLTLNEGRPLLPPDRLPTLTRPDGTFHDTYRPLVMLLAQGRLRTSEARAEWQAQVERALQAGVRVSHLDSHKHVHLLPPLLDAAIALAREHHIPYVRLPLQPLSGDVAPRAPMWLVLWLLAQRARVRLLAAGLTFAAHFAGFSHSGRVTAAYLEKAVLTAPQAGVTEIMTHPAAITPAVRALQGRYGWAARYRFEEELEGLCSPQVKQAVQLRLNPG
jgi:hopanoid biosynthesis associated protein HpnK